MPLIVPNPLKQFGPLVDALEAAASASARAAVKTYRAAKRRPAAFTLKPGPGTPLWNELARACRKELTRHGDKAKLARILGIPRQRLHLVLVAKSACPDAERTLLLLAWLRTHRARSRRRN